MIELAFHKYFVWSTKNSELKLPAFEFNSVRKTYYIMKLKKKKLFK